MAIYHCSIKPISRGAGQSIVAAAAYRHGCRLENKRTGEIHDYRRKHGVTASAPFFPSGIDCSWAKKSEILWNAAEFAEKRKDARLGREIVLALPSELSPLERKRLAAEMAQHVADRYGVAVDTAIHAPSRHGDDRNFHVHMLVSARRITPNGFGEKTRELDDRERGPAEIEHLRSEWALLANRALEQAGQHVQIDHRSFQRQGVKRMPTLHLGPSASALERRGVQTRLGNRNRSAKVINSRVKALEGAECQKFNYIQWKTQLSQRSVSEIHAGMTAFVNNFATHKKKTEEEERRKQERLQQAEKRRKEALERLTAMKNRVPEDRLSSCVDMAYVGYFKLWRQENKPVMPWTAETLRQADMYIAARLIAEGRDLEKITAALEKQSPAAALLTEGAYAKSLVLRTAERPEVQEQRKESLEQEWQRQELQNQWRSMSFG